MKNEPVAWMTTNTDDEGEFITFHKEEPSYGNPVALYADLTDEKGRPMTYWGGKANTVKGQKCVVQDCENHKHEGSFNGDLCSPCYQFIAHGKGVYSQAYRNTHPVKEQDESFDRTASHMAGEYVSYKPELTDEEINKLWAESHEDGIAIQQGFTTQQHYFAHLILRKAQE